MKQRDQGNGVAAAAVPVGFDRVCALLAEAVIGMMADTRLSSRSQGSGTDAPVRGESRQTTNSGSARSPFNLDERIVAELRESGGGSPGALRAKLSLQRTPCTKALNRLLAKGVLVAQGSTRKRVYRLAQPSQSAAA
ncbi:MAG: winged helix-turn-helix domain-containing protein [Lacunisphaera sp.]|nr:winged helix-turn-helix domain-containing protein [Lacunisphaera sp.]